MVDEEKKSLFEDLCVHYEHVFKLPPLAAKIYAYLLLSREDDGHSFEEFVEVFNASKSSISSNLNLLIQINKVGYSTKIDSRKRFFKVNSDYFLQRLRVHLKLMEDEVRLLKRIRHYKEQEIETKLVKIKMEGISICLEHMILAKDHLEETIKRLIEINKQLN